MAVNVTTPAPSYFLQPLDNGKQPLVSSLELAAIYNKSNPKMLGAVVAEDLESDSSIFAEIMAKGNEFVFATDQVIWEETENAHSAAMVAGTGAVSFTSATSTFTINAAALTTDAYDIDTSRPTEATWVQVKVGMNFVAFDTLGNKKHGVVTAIAGDKKSFTASSKDGGWGTLAASNLTVVFTGNNLDHCELAPCIGYQNYAPKRENSMFKDSECVEYCRETEIANGTDGADAYTIFPSPDGDYTVDARLNDAQKVLTARNDFALAFEKRSTINGQLIGTNGILTVLEQRATKNEGMITTLADAKNLAASLRARKIKTATIRCSNEQFTALVDLFPMGSTYSIDPFTDKTNTLFYIGYKGFQIGDVTILFKQWDALDQVPNAGARYHYIVEPEGKLRVKFNGKVQTAGYLNIGWFGTSAEVFKYLRIEERMQNPQDNKINYVNKFMPIVLRPQDWFIGVTVPA